MATRKAILYLDTPENRETACDCGLAFGKDAGDLAAQMGRLLRANSLRQELGQRAQKRAEALFGWDGVTEKYESLFAELLTGKTPVPAPVPAASPQPEAETITTRPLSQPAASPAFYPSTEGHFTKLRAAPAEGKEKLVA